jgi:hypothetical protein
MFWVPALLLSQRKVRLNALHPFVARVSPLLHVVLLEIRVVVTLSGQV